MMSSKCYLYVSNFQCLVIVVKSIAIATTMKKMRERYVTGKCTFPNSTLNVQIETSSTKTWKAGCHINISNNISLKPSNKRPRSEEGGRRGCGRTSP